MSEIIAEHLKGCDTIKIYDPTSGFRVIIMTVANSSINIRLLRLLPKFKSLKLKVGVLFRATI